MVNRFPTAMAIQILLATKTNRALCEHLKAGQQLKIGYGVYPKARQNAISAKVMPAAPGGSAAVVIEALERLKLAQ